MRVYKVLGNIIGWVACLVMVVVLLLEAVIGFIRTHKWKNPYKYDESLEKSPVRGREE